ncbi:vesicle-associated membrane protein 7-like [Ornithodoros turicata]|uniref:Vesicle-associated membrane protein 7 n=1 Tax=Ornithodoros turicata TaxID=34597 RepID=A0A2R5L4N3_9ACAR
MPILYCVVARGGTVLSRYASCAGNFAEVTEQILQRVSADTPKLTYTHGSYLFHYILKDGIIYLCITDDEFDRAKAFHFLSQIQTRFQVSYGRQAHSALAYAMNSEFSRVLANEMKHYSEKQDRDAVQGVQEEIDELKDIMVKNIDSVAARGERLELLVNKADNLSTMSVSFRKASRNLHRSMLLKNIKLAIIITIVVIIVLYIIVSSACGGLAWPNCV